MKEGGDRFFWRTYQHTYLMPSTIIQNIGRYLQHIWWLEGANGEKTMQWLNQPTQWSHSGNQIVVKTAPKTDFWRITHYGFIRDNGHFYFDRVSTDFVVEVKIRGNYRDLYDQAGIMIRADEKHWIKTGIEYVDGVQNLSAVVTNNYSDWSMTPLLKPPAFLQLRVERRQEAVHISYLDEALSYTLFRMAYLPDVTELQVGVMCASPEGDGYEVVFEDYQLALR